MIESGADSTLYKLSTEGLCLRILFYTAFYQYSGGEFQNLTGLYPKAAFSVSMSETGGRDKPSLYAANRLNQKSYTSIGYHF